MSFKAFINDDNKLVWINTDHIVCAFGFTDEDDSRELTAIKMIRKDCNLSLDIDIDKFILEIKKD
jgi:hypothetical protein